MYRRRGGFGRLEERALIFRLLNGRFPSLGTDKFSRICRGNQAREASWTWALQQHEHIEGVRELQNRFIDALAGDQHLKLPRVDAESLSAAADRERPSRLMGSLRTALAIAALHEVRPDLVIFDEFQKFREILIDRSNGSPDPVTRVLRGGTGVKGHAVLLLSATPYRLYSSRQDEAASFSHHQDFFELIRFLFDHDSDAPKKIEHAFLEFGAKMLAKETPDSAELRKLRDDIQARLRPVLSRTERQPSDLTLPFNENHPVSEIRSEDLRVFKHWVARLQAGENQRRGKFELMAFAVPYWQSVPLPIQTMGTGYVAWRRADRRHRRRDEPTLRRSQRDRLEAPKLWPHPQLRVLNKIVPASRLALPWVAPSLPWWGLRGPWSEPGASGGKLLIFTRFKAVPPALASLLSFDLEASFAHRLDSYRRAGEAQPLQFKGDRPTLPALFFPSPTLIAFTDPRRDKPSNLAAVRNSMRRQVGQLLKQRLKVQVRKGGRKRPLWKLLPALEYTRARLVLDTSLPSWLQLHSHFRNATGQAEVVQQILPQWNEIAQAGLSWVTEGEVAALAEFALSGPGVVLGRALYRFDRNCIATKQYGRLLDASWNGLRPYLNRSVFQAALSRRGQSYTKAILEAVVAGNLESVLDEHLWITSRLDADAIERFPSDLLKIFGLREGRHRLYEPGSSDENFSLRCHSAMPFADAKVENVVTGGESRLRTDDMRRSFNTPFWPHVLATTSLGQEGLDFHVWCRQLLHWDLCPSPLDLEQREGRIQRFGGLSVRSALAAKLGQRALNEAAGDSSPWEILAGHAEHDFSRDTSGRSPWWTCPDEKIDRLFVVLPQSRQTARFNQLSRLRWVYRLALGQPHQQDFIETVSELPDDGRHEFSLSLSAWRDAG